jgi:hypothetical protein
MVPNLFNFQASSKLATVDNFLRKNAASAYLLDY